MPLSYEFLENGRLIRLIVTDPWTVQDLLAFYREEQSCFDKATSKVHTLVDCRNMKSIPNGVLKHGASPNIKHRNSGVVALVGTSAVAQALVNAAFRLAHFGKARFFSNIEDAQQFLQDAIRNEETQHLHPGEPAQPVQTLHNSR